MSWKLGHIDLVRYYLKFDETIWRHIFFIFAPNPFCALHMNEDFRLTVSVTRFGENSPLRQNFNKLLAISSIWQNSKLWQIFNSFWQIFISLKGQIVKNNIAIWSHCESQCEVSLTRRDNAGRLVQTKEQRYRKMRLDNQKVVYTSFSWIEGER